MGHKGFKGDRLGLQSITLQGGALSFEVQFLGETGLVHAVSRHSLPRDADKDVSQHLEALSFALLQWAARTHFNEPQGSPEEKVPVRGIAETIGAITSPIDPADDEP